MEPYLIQRAKFTESTHQGIASILSFDYMGSAEFEWGALPKSLKRIRENLEQYVYVDIHIKNKVITVLCKESQQFDMKLYLLKLSKGEPRLKEFSAFDSYINDKGYYKDRFDFWWDIGNHLMFWKKNPVFEEKFKALIKVKPA